MRKTALREREGGKKNPPSIPAVADGIFLGELYRHAYLLHVPGLQDQVPVFTGGRNKDQPRLLASCHHVPVLPDHEPEPAGGRAQRRPTALMPSSAAPARQVLLPRPSGKQTSDSRGATRRLQAPAGLPVPQLPAAQPHRRHLRPPHRHPPARLHRVHEETEHRPNPLQAAAAAARAGPAPGPEQGAQGQQRRRPPEPALPRRACRAPQAAHGDWAPLRARSGRGRERHSPAPSHRPGPGPGRPSGPAPWPVAAVGRAVRERERRSGENVRLSVGLGKVPVNYVFRLIRGLLVKAALQEVWSVWEYTSASNSRWVCLGEEGNRWMETWRAANGVSRAVRPTWNICTPQLPGTKLLRPLPRASCLLAGSQGSCFVGYPATRQI